jgi:DNA-binding transcriptional ArsR family regulator
LGDPTRLGLLSRLHDGRARSLVQLTEGSGLTRQGVSKHLRVLEQAGVVRNRRIGRETLFVLEPAGLERARQYLERASRQWEQAATRLRTFLTERR